MSMNHPRMRRWMQLRDNPDARNAFNWLFWEAELAEKYRRDAEDNDQNIRHILAELSELKILAVATVPQLRRVGKMTKFEGTLYIKKGVDEEEIKRYKAAHPCVRVYRNVVLHLQ